jgi:formate dehydrogenase major subunit
VCPYCAVGCGQRIYVKDEKVVQIEGDPDSPSAEAGCAPRAAASEQLVNAPQRRPRSSTAPPAPPTGRASTSTSAIDMIADRFIEARRRTWQDHDAKGRNR